MNLKMAVAFTLLFVATQSYAIDCSGLDRKSNAYQTCLLRQENAQRDASAETEKRQQESIREKKRIADEIQGQFDVAANLRSLGDIEGAHSDYFRANCIKDVGFASKNGAFALLICKPYFVLLALNKTSFAIEGTDSIEAKKLESVKIGGVDILNGSESYSIKRFVKEKGIAVYIEPKDYASLSSQFAKWHRANQGKSVGVMVALETNVAKFEYVLNP